MWLDLDGRGPLHEQTYRALRAAILEGRLARGIRLPATRTLAHEAGLSRNTVLHAYRQLLDEGYLVARRGSGTFVSEGLSDELLSPPGAGAREASAAPPLRLSEQGQRLLAGAPRPGVSWSLRRRRVEIDFRYGEPAYADLPLDTWCRLLGRRARRVSVQRLAYGDPAGAPELRRALAGYLGHARGVACSPEQIVVTHGSQQAIDLVARALVDPGDRVVLEEPHYTGFSLALGAYGAELVPVPVDADGLAVDRLPAGGGVRGVCVTPAHQFPTGAVLPLERRLALLGWAERTNAFVLEDDYDGEYRYEGRPLPCLQSLDRADRVLYVGTASKILFPSLRVGWLVAPDALVTPLTAAKAFADTGSAGLEQLVLADFIEGGHLDRHVRRSRVRNAARREALQEAVASRLAGVAELDGTRAGLHGLLWLHDLPAAREAELRQRAEAHGVGIYPVHPYYRTPPATAGYVLGYAALDEARIRDGIERLARAVDEL